MLKKVRVVVALLIGFLFFAVFVDFRGMIPEAWARTLAETQFVPALLRMLRVGWLAAAALVALLVVTLITGRTYCSFLCPLGIMQDLLSRLGKRFNLNQKYRFRKAIGWLRYGLLALAVIVFLTGSASIVNLLDPYSIFGRTVGYLAQPLVVLTNNLAAFVLNKLDYFGVYAVKLPLVHWQVLVWTGGWLALVAVLALRRGRLYCNTVCPVGTLLGFLSRVSVFKVKLTDSCTACGKCARVCKAECIDPTAQTVDSSRCVACFNCLEVCRFNAIGFSSKKKHRPLVARQTNVDVSKRQFFRKVVTGSAVLSVAVSKAAAVDIKSNKGLTPLNRKHHASPPGSESLPHFNATCTGCSLCVTACPTKVLQPAFLEYGLAGMMQPFMDFGSGLCTYECTACSEVCPTGAIFRLTIEQKKKTQVGVAKFIQANCIVETHGTDCGACSEHCPTKAVNMVPYKGKLVIPEVKEDICVGCGACEHACPVSPYKAIFVAGHELHQEAKPPKTKKAEIEIEEDFPF